MKKNLYLDMDGTIANLYGIKGWLQRLRNEDENLFKECEPMVTEQKLFEVFKEEEFEIKILSMTPLGASEEYCKDVERQKNEWLDIHFPKITKRIYLKYGNNKNLKNSKNAILVDDNEEIRENFKGIALNPIDLW